MKVRLKLGRMGGEGEGRRGGGRGEGGERGGRVSLQMFQLNSTQKNGWMPRGLQRRKLEATDRDMFVDECTRRDHG